MRAFADELRRGFGATVRLSRLRGHVRTPAERFRTRVGGVVVVLLLVLAAFAGDLVGALARRAGPGSPVYPYLIGESSVSLAGALGTVLVGVLFAPITGAAAQAQFPDMDLSGIRPARLYRFFDGIWNSVVSPVGLSPLVLLVAAASLETSDGPGRPAAVAVALAAWVCALGVMALLAWVIEYVRRRWVSAVRWYVAAGASLVLAVVVLIDPAHGRTILGLGTWLGAAMAAARAGQVVVPLAALLVMVVSAAAVLLAGAAVCRQVLLRPAPVERVRQRTGSVTIPVHPSWAVFTMLVTTLARTREVRRPIIMMILVAMPMLFVWIRYSGSDPTSMLGSVTMVVPLAMSLGWGVNVFGVLGGAVTLLLAQPRAWRLLLRHVVLVQLLASVVLGLGLMVVAVLTTSMPWSVVPPYAVGLVAASVIATTRSVRYSVEKPHRTRLTGRGDPLVPPIVGMGYVIRIMATAATTGLAVGVLVGFVPWAGVVVVVVVALVGYRGWRRVAKRWNDPLHRARVAAVVGAV